MIAHSSRREWRRAWTEGRLTGRLPWPRGRYIYYVGRPPASPDGSLRRQPAHGRPTCQPSLHGQASARCSGQDRTPWASDFLPSTTPPSAFMIGCTIAALGPNSAGSDICALRLSRLADRHHGLHWMTKTQRNYNGPVLALSSAFLFGASTPIAKLLLGITDPLLLAGLLYLGSGAGLALVETGGRSLGLGQSEAPLRAPDLPWLAASILFGG